MYVLRLMLSLDRRGPNFTASECSNQVLHTNMLKSKRLKSSNVFSTPSHEFHAVFALLERSSNSGEFKRQTAEEITI